MHCYSCHFLLIILLIIIITSNKIGYFYDENYYLVNNLANKFSIPMSRDWDADNPGIRD